MREPENDSQENEEGVGGGKAIDARGVSRRPQGSAADDKRKEEKIQDVKAGGEDHENADEDDYRSGDYHSGES